MSDDSGFTNQKHRTIIKKIFYSVGIFVLLAAGGAVFAISQNNKLDPDPTLTRNIEALGQVESKKGEECYKTISSTYVDGRRCVLVNFCSAVGTCGESQWVYSYFEKSTCK